MIKERGYLLQAKSTSFGVQSSSSEPCLGTKQYYDGVVAQGRWKPGMYRVNPVNMVKTKGVCSAVDIVVPYQAFGSWYHDHKVKGCVAGSFTDLYDLPAVPYLHPEVCLNRAQAKLNKPTLDVGLMLGELSETLTMLRHPLSSLYPLIKDFRRNAKSKHQQKPSTPFSKVLSSTWLEYCYGILPILNDIQEIKETFEKQRVRELEVLRRQAASTMKEVAIPSKSGEATGYYVMYTLEGSAYSSKRVTTHIYYKYNDWARNYEALTEWGVNPFQLLDIAYAVTPYSFVVNWFVDIGSWLKAIQPHPHLDIIGGCTTIKTVQSKRINSYMAKSLNGASAWVPCLTQFDWEKAQLDRVLQTSWSAPPTIGAGIDNLSKAVNSAAMLWQRIPLKW